ncbi:MAG: InlB B-repeat-containing protein, partial [Oscillospiraceae bacterium]|nr:InlB B-repeat-containing protein [Oscillospiraceae bacterium]
MKSFKKTVIALLLVISVLALCACAAGETKQNEEPTPEPEDPNAGKVCKVTYVDGDGTTVLLETEIAYGTILTEPDNLVKEGYIIEGFYATPALKYPFEFGSKLTRDTRIFVAWKSGIEDNRPWMLAGSLRGYPENAWGKIWPQDDFL